jgi:hypothetical protein
LHILEPKRHQPSDGDVRALVSDYLDVDVFFAEVNIREPRIKASIPSP